MATVPRFLQLGELEVVEIYEFYDRPLLYSCRNAAGHLFLAVLSDETDSADIWLYVPLSQRRLDQVRSGVIDLHDAFSRAEGGLVYQVVVPYDPNQEPKTLLLTAEQLPDDQLPLQDERLSIKTDTLPASVSVSELHERATQSLRDHVTLHLSTLMHNLTEVPAELLGEVLERFQQLLNSVSSSLREIVKSKGPYLVPQMNVQGFSAGSFAVELVSDRTTDLFGMSEVGRAMEQVISLIQIGDDTEQLKLRIHELKPRVAVCYALFLKTLNTNVSDVRIDWASPKEGTVLSVHITAQQADNTVEIIERIDLQPPQVVIITGTLVGANLRGKTFEISAVDQGKRKKYTGRIHDDFVDKVRGAALGGDYRVTLVQTLGINYTTGQADPKYTLIQLDSSM